MYAIVESGGKQYKVEEGRYIDIDLLQKEPDEPVEFAKVLLVNDGTDSRFGTPYLENCKVTGRVLKNYKGDKVTSFKYRRRKDSHVMKGHRHWYSQVMIEKITA
ncbi:MAG: 50S ribosomal protein L21 [Candidatus Wallbacteria bacterium]|nr:50S ribosomal protein L21 [Candidatus Wallbacteria bacterium]